MKSSDTDTEVVSELPDTVSLLAALENLEGISIQIHQNFKPILVSDQYARFHGFNNAQELMATGSLLPLLPEEHISFAKQRYRECIEQGETKPITIRSRRADGSFLWVRVQDRRIYMHGEPCAMTFVIDVNDEIELQSAYADMAASEKAARYELQAMQETAIEQEKQAAMSALLRGVSHQLNTPLGNIKTAASVIKQVGDSTYEKFIGNQIKRSDLDAMFHDGFAARRQIEKSVDRISQLFKNVKHMLAEHEDHDVTQFRLEPIVSDAIKLVVRSHGRDNIALENSIAKSLIIYSNPNIWLQLFAALAENAAQHAFPGGAPGRISVDTEITEDCFILLISDDGIGVNESEKNRIFEAFYSSNMGSFSGLGLTLVYNLVTRLLDGDIATMPSKFGQGFGLKIKLPVTMISVSSE